MIACKEKIIKLDKDGSSALPLGIDWNNTLLKSELPHKKHPFNWQNINHWEAQFKKILITKLEVLPELLIRSDNLFIEFDGDPVYTDWDKFRPLRLNREEDWSDWLATLIEIDDSGIFLSSLGLISKKLEKISVDREYSAEDRRADILINYNANEYIHIEVKLSDTAYEKTYDTSNKLQKKCQNHRSWFDYILVPDENIEICKATIQNNLSGVLQLITWSDICAAIRKSFSQKNKLSLIWKTWAWSFLGCIQQKILTISPIKKELILKDMKISELQVLSNFLKTIEKE